jgi:hypothetical protein
MPLGDGSGSDDSNLLIVAALAGDSANQIAFKLTSNYSTQNSRVHHIKTISATYSAQAKQDCKVQP